MHYGDYSQQYRMFLIIVVVHLCRHGCPEIVITDQGREFVNEITRQLYEITGTQHRLTSPYHPQV